MLALLIDMLLACVVIGCAWIGSSLGLAHSSIRTISFIGSFTIAMLVVVPAGRLVAWISPFGSDTARLVGMLLVAAGSYAAIAVLVRWCFTYVDPDRVAGADGTIGGAMGAVLGAAWGIIMVMLVMLVPLTGRIPEAAIRSTSGTLLMQHASGLLRTINETFPHYTQTLPKGPVGAQLRHQKKLTLAEGFMSHPDPDAAGRLYANINEWRTSGKRLPATWGPEIADAATLHSRSMLDDAFLDTDQIRAGSKIGTFEERMIAALGADGVRYTERHEIVVWAHSTAHAMQALTTSRRMRSILGDRNIVEIGVGAAEAGWFNGTMFTIGIVGRERPHTVQRTG